MPVLTLIIHVAVSWDGLNPALHVIEHVSRCVGVDVVEPSVVVLQVTVPSATVGSSQNTAFKFKC